MVRIAIIIPCYNESENVLKLASEIQSTTFPDHYLITPIFINDCSVDDTLSIIRSNHLNYIDLPVNLGIGGAVQTGLKYALLNNFDYAIQMDGDGQHPPSELVKIIGLLETDTADLVIGSRFIDNNSFRSSPLRRAGIMFLSRIIQLLTGKRIKDCTSGFRGFNKIAIEMADHNYPDEYPEPESIVYFLLNKIRIQEISVIMRERQGGNSSIYGWKSLYYMSKVSIALLFNYLKYSNKNANH